MSDLPGRLRIRLKELRWQDQLAAQCTQALGSLPGINQVEVSTVTGSILVHYDTACYASSVVLLNAMAAAVGLASTRWQAPGAPDLSRRGDK